jgi:hypothetical protein
MTFDPSTTLVSTPLLLIYHYLVALTQMRNG